MQTILTLFLVAAIVSVSLSIKCQKCESTQGDCNSPTCDTGVWCTAIITESKATRTRTVKKDCASQNPSAKIDDGCMKDTLADGSDVYRCGCNSVENCNSEAGIARLQAMLNNQFALPGAGGAAPFPGSPNQPQGSNGQPSNGQPSNGQPPNGQPPNGQPPNNQIPPGLINPNSTFTEVLAAQPTPFPGANPNQPGQPNPPPQLGPNSGPQPLPLPNSNNPNNNQQVPQFPPPTGPNGSQQPFPQSGPNVPPPNQNKPNGPRPGGQPETDTGFAGAPPVNGLSPNSNSVDLHSNVNSNDSNRIPTDNHPATNDLGGNRPVGQDGRSRAGPVSAKNGMRTCTCTEPSCNGPCKGDVCYQMMFSASDVHSPAFAGKQGTITQSGCSDDPNLLASGSHNAHRQVSDYKFKINGQDIIVPATATYCNDNDYCNGASNLMARSLAIIAGVSLTMALLIRF